MRINSYLAQATGLSRRRADDLIKQGRVELNGKTAQLGAVVTEDSQIKLDGRSLRLKPLTTIMFNKPSGYIVSRKGQGAETIYSLLPNEFANLKPIGRLDKDSSGLLLLSNDGQLSESLTHPGNQKDKVYEVNLDLPLSKDDLEQLKTGVQLEDGPSKLRITGITRGGRSMSVILSEGRNRQIRRSFAALGYHVESLHRIQVGEYMIGKLRPGQWVKL
jgi:23S rRNA pseudouridine2605 synthase